MSIKEIINAFDSLPKTDLTYPNIFQIMRIGHLEKVSSNLISYFSSDKKNPDIKYSFLKALSNVSNINSLDKFFDVFSKTEVVTNSGKKIDIIIGVNSSDLFVIENKIYHQLNNDLDDYFDYINQNTAYSEYKKHFIVLSLYPINIKHQSYINITHDKLCKEFKKIYGYNLIQQNSQSMLINDYCNNILNLSGSQMYMNHDIYPFTEKYYYKIQDIISEMENYSNFSKEKILSFKDYYEATKDQYKNIINNGEYFDENSFSNKFLAVYFFEFMYNNTKYAIDVNFNIDGWEISVFCREPKKTDKTFIEKITNKRGEWRDNSGLRYYLSEMFLDRNISNEKIMNSVNEILSNSQLI